MNTAFVRGKIWKQKWLVEINQITPNHQAAEPGGDSVVSAASVEDAVEDAAVADSKDADAELQSTRSRQSEPLHQAVNEAGERDPPSAEEREEEEEEAQGEARASQGGVRQGETRHEGEVAAPTEAKALQGEEVATHQQAEGAPEVQARAIVERKLRTRGLRHLIPPLNERRQLRWRAG